VRQRGEAGLGGHGAAARFDARERNLDGGGDVGQKHEDGRRERQRAVLHQGLLDVMAGQAGVEIQRSHRHRPIDLDQGRGPRVARGGKQTS